VEDEVLRKTSPLSVRQLNDQVKNSKFLDLEGDPSVPHAVPSLPLRIQTLS
jgi:hypothetical protein